MGVIRTMARAVRPLPLVVGIFLLTPGSGSGQDPLGTPLRERAELRALLIAPHGELGVVLGQTVEVGERTGVRILEVRTGSPAERAGVRAADVLVSLDGQPLGTDAARDVRQFMRDVAPGDTVTVVVRRDGQDRTMQVVTGRRTIPTDIGGRIGDLIRESVLVPDREEVGRALESLREFRLGLVGRHGLELVEMNPGLGRYFGVDTGVLVADVAAESSLGLQPGDVILSIDGRTLRNPTHARAILASYQDEEEMEIEIMRDRRMRTVRATPSQ